MSDFAYLVLVTILVTAGMIVAATLILWAYSKVRKWLIL